MIPSGSHPIKVQLKIQLKKINKALASLKLAVFIILSLAVITATGTIIEAKYDALAAKKLVYDTWIMYSTMALLIINLLAVMVDRFPWKRRHISFVLAHIGIIVLLFGAWLTMRYGIDGSMVVPIGGKSSNIQTSETDLVVYSSFDGDRYSKIFEQEVDFFRHPPTEKTPIEIPAFESPIKVVDYKKYVLPSKKVVADPDGKAGAGLRFQIQNERVNVIEWLVQRKAGILETHDFGPAQVHLGPAPEKGAGKNEIYLTPVNSGVRYTVFHKDSDKIAKTGLVNEGDSFDPSFKMPMQVRVLRFFSSALENWDLKEVDHPTPLTTSAVKVVYEGKEQWVLLNDMVKFFTKDMMYLLTYGNRRRDIGFALKLISFDVDRYQGTQRAMAYKSLVEIPEIGQHSISMNEPLKHKGLTIYQSSFQEEGGKLVASIFSVNSDPGRFLKYLGSLIISLGIIVLMWFKQFGAKPAAKAAPKSESKPKPVPKSEIKTDIKAAKKSAPKAASNSELNSAPKSAPQADKESGE